MGYSLSWIATRGMAQEEIHELLKLRAISEEEPNPAFSCTAALLASGWHVVFLTDGCDSVDRRAKGLLEQCPEAITFFLEEHVMASGVAAWKDGEKVWSVEHHSEEGVFDLKTEGSPPEVLGAISAAYRSQQEEEGGDDCGVDVMIEVPVALGDALVGFRHDGEYDYSEGDPWYVCEMPPGAVTRLRKGVGCLPVAFFAGAAITGALAIRMG